MNKRSPDPQTLQRKLNDIKLRYDSHSREVKAKNSNRSRGMAAIRLAELTRWMADVYGAGVELEPDDYQVVRIFVHHIGALKDAPRRINDWVRTYAPWISPHDLERLILETELKPMCWGADKLGWKIKLTDAKRTDLRITSIGGYDFPKDQRKARDKTRRAEREKARRARNKANRVPSI